MKKSFTSICLLLLLVIAIFGCSKSAREQSPDGSRSSHIKRELFGQMEDGREVYLYTISNDNGMTVKMTNYGGIITSIVVPDKNGNPGDVVLGFDSLNQYLQRHPHMGPLIGRYSGYVGGAKFSIDGVQYQLAKNSGDNHLHGGMKAFDKVLWDAEMIQNTDGRGVTLTYRSPDGEEGYPGNVNVSVTYLITDGNALVLQYQASSDKKTHLNLTNHLYFNLSAMQSPDIFQHVLNIPSTYYAVPGKGNIPTELKRVEGTPLDFVAPHSIGERIAALPGGYDHNYVVKNENNAQMIRAATVYEPGSGRIMEVQTTHTGLEFASAGWLNVMGKAGSSYGKSSGFLLYPQSLPDSPNRPDFPSTLLEPGKVYSRTTIYRFSAGDNPFH